MQNQEYGKDDDPMRQELLRLLIRTKLAEEGDTMDPVEKADLVKARQGMTIQDMQRYIAGFSRDPD